MFIKKISILVAVLLFSFLTVQSTQAATLSFKDLSSSHPQYKEIMHLVDLGVLEGSMENGKRVFKANEQITRGQAAKMVVIAMKKTPLVVQKSSFSDIDLKTNAALSGYVERAVALGYMSEYSKGKFEPKMALTRNEMSVVLSKAFNLDVEKTANSPLPFSDVAKTDPYYKYIAAIYYNGITNGTVAGSKVTYSAKSPVTRSQFSSFVARAISEKYRLALPEQPVAAVKPNEAEAIDKVIVAIDGLNVRSTAKSENQTNILGKLNTGKELPVFEDQGYWLKVAYNGQFAFVAKEYTKSASENQEEPAPEIEKPVEKPAPPAETEKPAEQPPVIEKPTAPASTVGIVTVNNLNIREKNSASSTSLLKVNRGTAVDVLSIDGYWAEISYKGTTGYVDKRYLRLKNTAAKPVKNRIIVLDAGHGGKDPGAVSGKAIEKEIVYKVTQLVKQKLDADGAKVLVTRAGDTYPTLDDRVRYTTNNYGEMFISIHANSSVNTSPKGTETFYSVTSNENEKEDLVLATNINNQIVKNAKMNNRGVKRQDFKVIKGLTIPAVLVELGFVSNAEDRAKLLDDGYIEIYAQSIYNGIVEYYAQN